MPKNKNLKIDRWVIFHSYANFNCSYLKIGLCDLFSVLFERIAYVGAHRIAYWMIKSRGLKDCLSHVYYILDFAKLIQTVSSWLVPVNIFPLAGGFAPIHFSPVKVWHVPEWTIISNGIICCTWSCTDIRPMKVGSNECNHFDAVCKGKSLLYNLPILSTGKSGPYKIFSKLEVSTLVIRHHWSTVAWWWRHVAQSSFNVLHNVGEGKQRAQANSQISKRTLSNRSHSWSARLPVLSETNTHLGSRDFWEKSGAEKQRGCTS